MPLSVDLTLCQDHKFNRRQSMFLYNFLWRFYPVFLKFDLMILLLCHVGHLVLKGINLCLVIAKKKIFTCTPITRKWNLQNICVCIASAELYSFMSVWVTGTFNQWYRYSRKQNIFCIHSLVKLSMVQDDRWCTFQTCWCDAVCTCGFFFFFLMNVQGWETELK